MSVRRLLMALVAVSPLWAQGSPGPDARPGTYAEWARHYDTLARQAETTLREWDARRALLAAEAARMAAWPGLAPDVDVARGFAGDRAFPPPQSPEWGVPPLAGLSWPPPEWAATVLDNSAYREIRDRVRMYRSMAETCAALHARRMTVLDADRLLMEAQSQPKPRGARETAGDLMERARAVLEGRP
jgi:hypothetical protein